MKKHLVLLAIIEMQIQTTLRLHIIWSEESH